MFFVLSQDEVLKPSTRKRHRSHLKAACQSDKAIVTSHMFSMTNLGNASGDSVLAISPYTSIQTTNKPNMVLCTNASTCAHSDKGHANLPYTGSYRLNAVASHLSICARAAAVIPPDA